ncbi:MAG: hypothetical protein IPK78_10865 [Rhodospirillales bacterium]|nr:hypothetical protein [Rhodospirillales bacterium]
MSVVGRDRYPSMRRQSVMVRAPETFLDTVLWPKFQEINTALHDYLARVTETVIRDGLQGHRRCRQSAGAGEDRAVIT